ncbi:polyprenol monophosphomannose synthase [Nocardioides daeguensis]|uniref:polyprenol monophosphomannose synthase n=1 Tax=Nocardioides daeguensis TaxID=908359 RepID=UPI001FE78DF3|nr:polyprenol monophosphomannose synthase [Nocardioides daeguensis]
MMTSSPALVVIPTYDERANVSTVLDRALALSVVARFDVPVHVLVVDDSSPDGTAEAVAAHPEFGRRVHLLVRAEKEGLGAAYRAGFAWALDRGYARVVQMDADLSHPPERIPALLGALDRHDLAVGSRYVAGGGVRNWPLRRRFLSWAGNLYVRLVLGLPVHDVTAGFKAFRAEALVELGAVDSQSDGYCFQIETTWQACRHGLSVTEVPITFVDRQHGHSKMSGSIVAEALVRVLGWRLSEARHVAVRPAAQPVT